MSRSVDTSLFQWKVCGSANAYIYRELMKTSEIVKKWDFTYHQINDIDIVQIYLTLDKFYKRILIIITSSICNDDRCGNISSK